MPRKKSKKTLLKEEAERLMYELAFKLYGKKCEVCGGTWKLVVHHFIPRHSWKAGTYEPLNLVILCGKCHFELHQKQNPNIVARIIEKRGKKWLNKLNRLYQKTKKSVSYYGEKWLQTQINQMKQKSQQLDKETNSWL